MRKADSPTRLDARRSLDRAGPLRHSCGYGRRPLARSDVGECSPRQDRELDPLIAHETQPTKTVAELVRSDERLKEEFARIRLPLLILHGTEDKAAKSSGSQFFYDRAGSTDKTLKLYEGHFHDLLNDVGKDTVMSDITSWIDVRSHAT